MNEINFKGETYNLDNMTAEQLDDLFNKISDLADYLDPEVPEAGMSIVDRKLAEELTNELRKIVKAKNWKKY
ncbi:hypothetical protein [Megamonas hypermegale]|uniref:hypothetical protein n=1 Tax=Megamonas hypermegale TaxID=158847 RepID=UPI0026F21283|nr:hypothetical protein [Megamonas hypermegale]